MGSKADICNMALSHIGVGTEVQNVDTEASAEAQALRRFFDVARDATLRDFAWPFAMEIVALPLVEENPNDEWGFSYRYPSDTIRILKILSGLRNDNRQSQVPYTLGRDDQGILIYTDLSEAQIKRTFRVTDTTLFHADFEIALSWRIAAYVAPRLTGGDPFKMGDRAAKMYEIEISRARASAINEDQADEDPQSEFVRSRTGDPTAGVQQDWQALPASFHVSG